MLNKTCQTHHLPTHPEPIDDKLLLGRGNGQKGLGLGPNTVQALAVPYSNISLDYAGGIRVSQADAAGCSTVGDAVNVVHKAANGTP
ncbi:MAG: hypothetical protein QOC70_308 [Verrucomicrobiota bacterium]|jgi:hypothetical protein